MMDLHHNGYNLQDTVIVTDRGYQSIYNIQRLLDIEINYVCGVPPYRKKASSSSLKDINQALAIRHSLTAD